jgi:hypothetical protein
LVEQAIEAHIDPAFEQSYQKASNRPVKEFINEFCLEDGSIDWERLVEFNSGR